MHILYLSALGGGLETNVRTLAPALMQAGHQVSILYLHSSSQGHTDENGHDGAAIYKAQYGDWHYYLNRVTFGTAGLPLLVRSFEAARAFTDKVRDIHSRYPLDLIEIPEVVLPMQKLPAPYVVRLHSSAWMCRRMYGEPSPWADSIDVRLEGATLRRAGAVTSPSQYVAEYIEKTCRLNEKVEIIPYPIDTNQFKPAPKNPSRKLVLFVGRVEQRKGADILLRAVPHVLMKHPECDFLFVGHVSDELVEQVKDAPVAVRFLDFTPRHELVGLYQQASIVVVPSQWDNSPNVIYEAMACGSTVIASAVGGIPELVDDGVTGLLVAPADEGALAEAIMTLLANPSRSAQIGKRGREKAVAEYDLDKIVAQTLGLYSCILQTCSKRSAWIGAIA